MKKIVTLIAATLMIVGLTGCMDDPDGSMQRGAGTSSNISDLL